MMTKEQRIVVNSLGMAIRWLNHGDNPTKYWHHHWKEGAFAALGTASQYLKRMQSSS